MCDLQSFGLVSKNPVMKNITDYLIEEASAEEEELLGQSSGDADASTGEDGESACTIDRDETLLTVLDRLLFYLRVVHSVDYYNHCEYPNEDEMPNRCGIMHARGTPPSSKVGFFFTRLDWFLCQVLSGHTAGDWRLLPNV